MQSTTDLSFRNRSFPEQKPGMALRTSGQRKNMRVAIMLRQPLPRAHTPASYNKSRPGEKAGQAPVQSTVSRIQRSPGRDYRTTGWQKFEYRWVSEDRILMSRDRLIDSHVWLN